MNWTLVALLGLFGVSWGARFYDDFSDLPGPYCQNTHCCEGRQDHCAVAILGTLCYCDDFCNVTRVGDCCPDYWSHCKGIDIPTTTTTLPPPRPTRPDFPPSPLIACSYKNKNYPPKSVIMDNCNKCSCTNVTQSWDYTDRVEMLCETNVCLMDQQIIETVNRGGLGWTAGNYSEFFGNTLERGIIYKLGTVEPQQTIRRMHPIRKIYNSDSLPKSFDAESKWPGWITPVQDQRWCGSSWALSTAAVASDRFSIISQGYEKVQLSAQNLVSCDYNKQLRCKGGYLDRAWSYIKKFGIVDEDCFPYTASNETKCTVKRKSSLQENHCKYPLNPDRKSKYKVGPAYKLRTEKDIMHEITSSGPVQATMKVYHDFFHYKNGIYKHTDLSVTQKSGYHSVRITGWGEEFTENGLQKYWKVANSWGPNWGENGYFRIARGENECEIESFVIAVWPQIEEKILRLNPGLRNSRI